MAHTIPLNMSDLFNSLPINLDLKPDDRGIAFTFPHPNYPEDTPIYRDPSHLACWVLGYLVAKAENENKEN